MGVTNPAPARNSLNETIDRRRLRPRGSGVPRRWGNLRPGVLLRANAARCLQRTCDRQRSATGRARRLDNVPLSQSSYRAVEITYLPTNGARDARRQSDWYRALAAGIACSPIVDLVASRFTGGWDSIVCG